MMRIIVILILSCICQKVVLSCECDGNCVCNETVVVCQDVSGMPCFPASSFGMTSLTIRDSPQYTKLNEDDIPEHSRDTLINVFFINVGFEKTDNDAFHNMYKLKNLTISKCLHLKELDFDSNTAPQYLEVLDLSGDVALRDIDGFRHLELLKTLDMTKCDLRNIYQATFSGMSKMQKLFLKNNPNLDWISRYAFEDMYQLEELNFENSHMETIYPQYFDTAWGTGTLKIVKGNGQYYKCDNMCDLSIWINDNPKFKNISDLGSCSYGSKEYEIENLDENDDNAGCGLGGWAIFGIVVACLVFGGAIVGAGAWWFVKRRK